MPQIVIDDDLGQIEFPDGMSNAEMAVAIRRTKGQEPPRFQFAPPVEVPPLTPLGQREAAKADIRFQNRKEQERIEASNPWLAKQNQTIPGQANAFMQEAQRGTGGVLQGLAPLADEDAALLAALQDPHVRAAMNPGERQKIIADIQARAPKTAQETIARIQSNPMFQAGKELRDTATETFPVPPNERDSLATKVSGAAGQFFPLIATGPAAPATIGLQSYGEHIDNDYQQMIDAGVPKEEAAQKTLDRALGSGAVQAGVFWALPKPLRKAGDKYLIDKFAPLLGEKAVTRFIASRAAQAGEGAVLGAASRADENVVTGQPVGQGVGEAAAGLALIQGVTPRGLTPQAHEQRQAFESGPSEEGNFFARRQAAIEGANAGLPGRVDWTGTAQAPRRPTSDQPFLPSDMIQIGEKVPGQVGAVATLPQKRGGAETRDLPAPVNAEVPVSEGGIGQVPELQGPVEDLGLQYEKRGGVWFTVRGNVPIIRDTQPKSELVARLEAKLNGEPNAVNPQQQQEGGQPQHPGIPQGQNLQPNADEIRQAQGGQAGGGGGSERAATEPAPPPNEPVLTPAKSEAGVSSKAGNRNSPFNLAVRLADGRVVSDPDAGIHALVLENQKIPENEWESVRDAGVVDTRTGEYIVDPQSQIKQDIPERNKEPAQPAAPAWTEKSEAQYGKLWVSPEFKTKAEAEAFRDSQGLKTGFLRGFKENGVESWHWVTTINPNKPAPPAAPAETPHPAIAIAQQAGVRFKGEQTPPAEPTVPESVPAVKRVARGSTGAKRFAAETELNGPDILSWIHDNMRLMSKSAAKEAWGKERFELNKSLWDDASAVQPHHNVIYAGGKAAPDRVAQAAYDARVLKEPSVNALWAAIKAASDKRKNAFATGKREAAFLKAEADEHEAWMKATAKGEERINADQLKIGDSMEVDGERIEVVGVDAEGNVTLKDGRRFGKQTLKEGQTIHVQAFDPAKEKSSGELFSTSETPFNLTGERGSAPEVKPPESTTGFGNETLAQKEMFAIQKITELKDPGKSADAAQKMYGDPENAAKILERQLAVTDSDPKTRKAFVKEQRERLKEVIALLRQRAESSPEGLTPDQAAQIEAVRKARGQETGIRESEGENESHYQTERQPADIEEDLRRSGKVLWTTQDEIERLLAGASRADSGGDERTGIGEPLHPANSASRQSDFQKAKFIIGRGRQGGLLERQSNLLAHRVIYGTESTDRPVREVFVGTLARKLATLKFIVRDLGDDPGIMQYDRIPGGDYVSVDATSLTRADFSDPTTRARWDAVMGEELIHAVTFRVSTERELSEVWKSLSSGERQRVKRLYRKRADQMQDFQWGAEYVRAIIQERLTGSVSEGFRERISEKAKSILRGVLDFIRSAFGRKPADNIARQIVERIEGAIRGDPIPDKPIDGFGESVASLIKSPEDYRKNKIFGERNVAGRTVGAYGDIAKLKYAEAEKLGLSDRARRFLNLPRQMEMYSLASTESAGIDNYYQARAATKDADPGLRWNVIQDALHSLGNDQRRSIKLQTLFEKQKQKVDSRPFQAKLERLVKRNMEQAVASQKEDTFRNIIIGKVAEFARQLEGAKIDNAKHEMLSQDLAQAKGLLGFASAVAQHMDLIVSRIYPEYWKMERASKSGKAFSELYYAFRSGQGHPVTDSQEKALINLASEVLAINSSLTEKMFWLEKMKREPDFEAAVNSFGKAFTDRMTKDPAGAIKELVTKEEGLARRAADAKAAFRSLHKEVLREVELYSDLEGAAAADARIKANPEWKQLVNTVHEDAGGIRIPDAILQQVKDGKVFNEFTGRIHQMGPTGNLHEIGLGWTKENTAKAQEKIGYFLKDIRDWMNDPKNEQSPDRAYWQRQHDFVDATYNTMAVLAPGSVKSLIFKSSWSMPEFFFRQAALPAAKVTQTSFENWHRAWVVGDQWARATEQPLIRALDRAARRHGFDVTQGLQEYREKVLNPLAWEYRHGHAVREGDLLLGVKITDSDITALKIMGGAINKLINTEKNIGAERVMPKELVYDEWAKGAFAIRAPQELGAEKGTTLPREFSSRAKTLATRASQLGGDIEALSDLFNQENYFEPFVMRWLAQRSADYSKVTPFEDLFKEIVQKHNSGAPDAPRSIEDIVQFIDENTDETYNADSIKKAVVGEMAAELQKFYSNFVERDPNDFSDVRVVRATKDGPLTTGFNRDIGSSFYYDYGIISSPEVRSMAIDASMYHMMRFANSLSSLEHSYEQAMLDLKETQGQPEARRKLLAAQKTLYRSGNDFRDFDTLQQQLNEVRNLRIRLPIFSGKDVSTYEGMRNLYRLIGDNVGLALSGWKTLARVLTGSVVKQGFVFGAMERFYAMSYAKAATSMAMSTFNIGVLGPAKLIGRRLGMVKAFHGELSGIAEELFRSSKFFNQQYDYGLGTKNPTLDTIINNLSQPYSHGRGYDPRLSGVWGVRHLQKGAYRFLSTTAEPVTETLRAIFPALGYAVAYDSVARQTYWRVKALEAQARRSFDVHERLGTLSKFDLENPKSVKNVLPPDQILPRGLMPSTQTDLNLARETFKRGTDMDLNDAVMQFWSKLAETPKTSRGDVHLLSADAKTPEEAMQLQSRRTGALASIGLMDIHHASPANRPWVLRGSTLGRVMFPIAGWFTQSTRQIFALLGRAPSDPKLSSAMLTAMTGVTILGFLAASTLLGDGERRVFDWLSWLLENKVDPVRHLGQGRDTKENLQIAASDATSYITILNSMFNAVLGEQSNRGQLGAQVFVTEQLNTWMKYFNGVAHTKNPLYGLPTLAGREVPLAKIILNRLPSQEGLQNERNAVTVIKRVAPPELIRDTSGSQVPLPTELSPIKEKLANAIYRGDAVGVAEAYDEFKKKAAELGRKDPENLAKQVVRGLNPYSIALGQHPTDAQRADILAKSSDRDRQVLLDAEQNYLAATQSIGVGTSMTKIAGGSVGSESSAGPSISSPAAGATRGAGTAKASSGVKRLTTGRPGSPRLSHGGGRGTAPVRLSSGRTAHRVRLVHGRLSAAHRTSPLRGRARIGLRKPRVRLSRA